MVRDSPPMTLKSPKQLPRFSASLTLRLGLQPRTLNTGTFPRGMPMEKLVRGSTMLAAASCTLPTFSRTMFAVASPLPLAQSPRRLSQAIWLRRASRMKGDQRIRVSTRALRRLPGGRSGRRTSRNSTTRVPSVSFLTEWR